MPVCRVNLKMDVAAAAKVVAVRPALEALIVKATSDPESLTEMDPVDSELIDVVRVLSRATAAQHSVLNTDEPDPALSVLCYF